MTSVVTALARAPQRAEPQAQVGHVPLPEPVDRVLAHHVRLQLRARVHHAPADQVEPVDRVLPPA